MHGQAEEPLNQSAKRRWPTFLDVRRLQGRMVLLFLALLVLVQGVSQYRTQVELNANALRAVDENLRNAQAFMHRLLQQRGHRESDALAALARELAQAQLNTPSLAPEALGTMLREHAAARRLSAVVWWPADGLPIASDASWAVAAPVLWRHTQGSDQALLLWRGKPHLLTVKRIAPGEQHRLSGRLAALQVLDDQELLEIKRLLNVDALMMLAAAPTDRSAPKVVLSVEAEFAQALAKAVALPNPSDTAAAMARSLRLDGQHWRVRPEAMPVAALLDESATAAPRAHLQTALLVLWFCASEDEALAHFKPLQRQMLLLGLVALAVFMLGSIWTARWLSQPIAKLARSVERLGAGDYDSPVRTASTLREVSDLADAFEKMRNSVRQREEQVQRLAYWDELTLLPNRGQFTSRLRQRLQTSPAPLALLTLNLDRFKPVNDALGRELGDKLLQQVALRLRSLVETLGKASEQRPAPEHLVARLGGDEFAVWLEGAHEAQAVALAQRILQDLEHPIRLGAQTVDLGAGIGIAMYPEHASDAVDLITAAERAMEMAKRRQAGALVFLPSMDVRSPASLGLLSELRQAVQHDELRLYLQPKLDLLTGRIDAAEGLVRWQHPHRGMVPPGLFIPFAEQTGFVRQLTGWVLGEAARQAVQARRAGLSLRISVNLSARDLLDADLPTKLAGILQREQATADMLCLEITESAIMDDPPQALATAKALNAQGFKLSIDDFGTGYSSLAYLKQLPVQELKIDQGFVFGMVNDEGDRQIVRSTIDLAHNLGLSVVAEGIETAAALALLKGWGCDQAQGYFIGKPIPADQLLARLALNPAFEAAAPA